MQRVKKTLKHIDEVNRIAARIGSQTDQAAHELTSGLASFMEDLIAAVEAGMSFLPWLWKRIPRNRRFCVLRQRKIPAGTPCLIKRGNIR